jgi:putative two-component system response regulator
VDLAVLDVVMPVMDGLEAARELRNSPLTFSIPIVFCTGSAHLVPTRFGEPCQADVRIIPKPFPLSELRETVRELLSRERTLNLAFSCAPRASSTT